MKWAQRDDIESLETLPSPTEAQNAPAQQKEVAKELPMIFDTISYRYARIACLEALHRFGKKEQELVSMSWKKMIKKKIDKIPPHKYFSKEDRLVWRILMLSTSTPWLTLPGPAEWWENYPAKHFQRYWDIPSGKNFAEIIILANTLLTKKQAGKTQRFCDFANSWSKTLKKPAI